MLKLLKSLSVSSCLLVSLLISAPSNADTSVLDKIKLVKQEFQDNIMTVRLENKNNTLIDSISIDLGKYFTDDVVDIFDSAGNQFNEKGLVYSLDVAGGFNDGYYDLEWVFTDPNTGKELNFIGYVGIQTKSMSMSFNFQDSQSGVSELRLPIVGDGDYNIGFPVSLSPVSEPSTIAMSFAGLAMLGGFFWFFETKKK